MVIMLFKCLSNQFITTLRNLQGENVTEQNSYKGYDPALTLGKGPTVKNENILSWKLSDIEVPFQGPQTPLLSLPLNPRRFWVLAGQHFSAKHSLGEIPDWEAGHRPRVSLCAVTLSAFYFIQVCEHLYSTQSKCKHYMFHLLSHF